VRRRARQISDDAAVWRRSTPLDAGNVKGGRLCKAVPCQTAWSVSLIFTRLLVFKRLKDRGNAARGKIYCPRKIFRDVALVVWCPQSSLTKQ
jgi:hypothetical protein